MLGGGGLESGERVEYLRVGGATTKTISGSSTSMPDDNTLSERAINELGCASVREPKGLMCVCV